MWNTVRRKGLRSGLHNSESSKGQIDQHKLAVGRKSLFRHSVEEILKGQVIIRSRAFAIFSATEFSRAARKDLAGRMWPADRMLCRPGWDESQWFSFYGVGNGLLLRLNYHTECLKPFSECGRTVFLRVSSSWNQIHKVLKPFSVVNVRGLQIFHAVRRAEELSLRLGFRWDVLHVGIHE